MAAGYVQELADPILENSYDMSEMKRMVIGAAFCLRQASQLRPRMSQVIALILFSCIYMFKFIILCQIWCVDDFSFPVGSQR